MRKLEQERDAGKTSKPGRKPTVAEWMITYLETICPRLVATGKMTPGTLDDYLSLNRVWITPYLGKHRLDRLYPDHLDELYTVMALAGRKESTVLKVHRVLSRALEVAHRRDKVGRNVAKLIDAPSAGDGEIKPLTQAEARNILTAAAKRRNGTRWAIGLAMGLRQGEAIGLRWEYVDLDAGQVRVWWQLKRDKWQHGCDDPVACCANKHRRSCPKDCPKAARTSGRRHRCIGKDDKRLCPDGCKRHGSTCPQRRGGLVFRPPKGKSKRTVPLPPELVPLLRLHRVAQNAERLAAGSEWEDHDLVFCQPDGRPIDPRKDWDDWKDLLAVAGVRDARVHDGRHTAATVLIELGVHVRIVQEILGHSDIRLTQRYTHVASPMAADAAQQMGRALWGGTP